jgi:hypothetical protein
VVLNNLPLNANGSPIVRVGQELNFGDSSVYGDQQLQMQNRLGGQIIAGNTALTQYNREQAVIAQQARVDAMTQGTPSGSDSAQPDVAGNAQRGWNGLAPTSDAQAESSFAALSAAQPSMFEETQRFRYGPGGTLQPNYAYAGPDAAQVPMAAPPPGEGSNFLGYTRSALIGGAQDVAAWGAGQGGFVGDAALWGGSITAGTLEVLYPGSNTELAAMGIGGPIVGRGIEVAGAAAVARWPVLGREVGEVVSGAFRPTGSSSGLVEMASGGDRLLTTMGPARLNNPLEYRTIMSELDAQGVSVNMRSGEYAYGPSSRPGQPGNVVVDPDASLSALRHEYGHFLDDQALGFPGMRFYMENPSLRLASERSQYLGEIRTARELGDQTARRELIMDYLQERNLLIETWYTRPYGPQ